MRYLFTKHARGFWLHALAVALGVTLGLLAAQCDVDNDPEGPDALDVVLHAQDGGEQATGQPVASFGRRVPLPVDNGPAPVELKFYQREPPCADRQPIYLAFRNGIAMTEHHRVWVCGYRR